MNTKKLTTAATISALYVILTGLAKLLNLDSGVIQVRFSEALCILPCFTPAAVPGLFIGCLLSNILTGGVIWDVIFGSLATLLGAIGTRLFRKNRFLAVLPPILANTLIVPFVLSYAYAIPGSIPYFMLTVGIGEIVSCGFLGLLLYSSVKKINIF
ncbi:MAG: QueT transporter family protein [Clostridia bacterium]|nr:QueT transporter family protein [Clostridia bacterium]